MSLKEVVAATGNELTQEFDKVEFIRSINYEELIHDPELYWSTFMKHCKVLETLTLEEFELLHPDLGDEKEEPECVAIVLYEDKYVSDPNDMGPFNRKWLRL